MMNRPAEPGDDAVPAQVPGLAVELIEDEVLVYHPEQAKALYLNATAAMVLGLCNGSRTKAEIVRLLSEGFPDAGISLALDVSAALEALRADGIIVFG